MAQRRKSLLVFVERVLQGEEAPRPGPVKFVPKNPEIPVLDCYDRKPPDEHFKHWPMFQIPTNIYTDVNVEKFTKLAEEAPVPLRSRLMEVANKLKFGSETLVEGIGREPTFSTNAPSAIDAGARTSDALASQIKKKAIAGPFKDQPFKKIKINGLMATERPDGDIRPVLNLSAPKGPDL